MNLIILTASETHQDTKYDGLMILSQNVKTQILQILHFIIYFYGYIFCPQLFNIFIRYTLKSYANRELGTQKSYGK